MKFKYLDKIVNILENKDYLEIVVFKLDRTYIKIQKCEFGYDYSIYDVDYKLIDGGVYEDLKCTLYDILKEIIIEDIYKLFINNKDIKLVDYEEFDCIIEEKEMIKFNILKSRKSNI